MTSRGKGHQVKRTASAKDERHDSKVLFQKWREMIIDKLGEYSHGGRSIQK